MQAVDFVTVEQIMCNVCNTTTNLPQSKPNFLAGVPSTSKLYMPEKLKALASLLAKPSRIKVCFSGICCVFTTSAGFVAVRSC